MKFFTVLFFLLSIIYLIAAAPGEPGAPIDYDEYGDSSEEIEEELIKISSYRICKVRRK
uniref:Salivary secreted peptide n=1 Tax=Glossina morsitans morsitans TaxID=37546 RepID=A0A1B0GFX1_GLOMM